MQDPKKDIRDIVQTLWTTRDAKKLEETVDKCYLPDAKLFHPLCVANSRNEILGLFQWYRLASPKTSIQLDDIMYDTDLNTLCFGVRETVDVWFNPFASRPGKMYVRLKLRKVDGLHRIQVEENLIHPMDQMRLLASPFVPLAATSLRLGCLLSNLGACVLHSVGLNSGLKGGTISYAGLLEAAGLSRLVQMVAGAANGSAK